MPWSTKLRKIEVVVQDLSSVVQHTAFGFEDDLLKRHGLEGCIRNSCVQVIDISQMMLAVVQGEGFGRDDRLQRI